MKKFINNFSEQINENDGPHQYCCAMLYFDFPEMEKIHQMIDPEDVYTDEHDSSYGLEKEPHTTLLYGLHQGVTPEDIGNTLNNFTFNKCKMHNTSLFENEKYDVLKFDVEGDSLHEVNAALKKFPFTSNYPDYHPHMTIGYLKPGKGKKYVDMLNGVEHHLAPSHIVYSQANGNKDTFPVNVSVNEEIVKVGNKWKVFPKKPKKGDKVRKALGTHDTKKEAVAQLRAIEISKNESNVLSFSQFINEKKKINPAYLTKDATAMRKEIKKNAKKSDDDPTAYVSDPKGEWKADYSKSGKRYKTKPSKHTLAYAKKYGTK